MHISQDWDRWIIAEVWLPTRIGDTTSKFGKHRKYLVVMGEGCKTSATAVVLSATKGNAISCLTKR